MTLVTILVQAALVVGALSAGSSPLGCLGDTPPDACQGVVSAINAARAGEQRRWVSNVLTDPFYQLPPNVSSYRPGDLIRLDRSAQGLLTNYTTPPGLTLYRMLYQSTDMSDRPIAASAFILLPYARSNKPLELVAWAHGTAGMGQHCAPSHLNNLYYEYEAPYSMAMQGFAVVAPDYAGLGTNITFHYLAGPAHAADMVHAVAAARQALPAGLFSTRWAAVGHSEGGLTAWATNEREARQPSGSGFLGSVALAPALANLRIIRANLARTQGALNDTLPYPAYTLTAIGRLNSSVDTARYFSSVGAERTALANTGCFDTARAAFQGLNFADVFRDATWLNASFAEAWEASTGAYGDRPLAKPMLLVAGLNDSAVPPQILEDTFRTQCTTHNDTRVRLSRYPGVDHDAVAFVAQLEYFDWLHRLFDGGSEGVPRGCENQTVDVVVQPGPGSPEGNSGEVGGGF